MQRAVFLDRDGVLNRPVIRAGKSYPPDSLKDFEILPGVESACILLKNAGFCLIVVTNQPDVATGKQKPHVVEAMHAKLLSHLPVDDIIACYHVDSDNCTCRKPRPGMIFAAAEKHNIDLSKSFLVGDRWKDIEAGQHAGCHSFFIDYKYAEKQPSGDFEVISDLVAAAELILKIARIEV